MLNECRLNKLSLKKGDLKATKWGRRCVDVAAAAIPTNSVTIKIKNWLSRNSDYSRLLYLPTVASRLRSVPVSTTFISFILH